MKILVVDDDLDIVNIIALTLRVGWPEATVVSASTGYAGLEMTETESPNLVVLDLGLPDVSGFQVLRDIRSFSDVPVVILTVSGEEANVVRALDMGANDYLTKPFRQMELLARFKAAMRLLYHPNDLETCHNIGRYKFYPANHKIEHNGKSTNLTPTESAILLHLARNQGKAVSYDSIANKLWSCSYPGAASAIRVYIGHLRRKMGEDAIEPTTIRSVPGVGYILNPSE
jgi:DNA-binding response OmpR family regulator